MNSLAPIYALGGAIGLIVIGAVLNISSSVRIERLRHESPQELPLRDRVFSLAKELRKFLEESGIKPDVDSIWRTGISGEEFTTKWNMSIQPWINRFNARYWRKFAERIVDIRHEFAEMNIVDTDLDKAISLCEKEPDPNCVNQIANSLCVLVGKLND